ncbi:MAG: FIST C-terminal domain-containing protein, partial [Actinomycetota bacterium]|nr:FIST C-terminal domain-containing protein [Actinomycetota bacterium]
VMTVTEVSGPVGTDVTVVTGLAGRPARTRLDEVLGALTPEELTLAGAGVYLGVARDGHEGRDVFDEETGGSGASDQLPVLGMDAASGGLAVGGAVDVGGAVRFEVRDPSAVEPELIGQAATGAVHATGAFVVMSATRGERFHGRSDVDAGAVAEAMDARPVAGVVVGAEFVPLGGRNRRVTSSLVVQPVG